MTKKLQLLSNTTAGANPTIDLEAPYVVAIGVTGTAALLFHRWNVEAVDEKSRARKGSAAKKTDDVESYVFRNDSGQLCLPGEYLRQSVIHAAKYEQDPRSPRKSAMDLFKAGLVVLDELCSLGATEWDFLDRRRVTIQKGSGITRIRPAMFAGWRAAVAIQVLVPEYINPDLLHKTFSRAGQLVGVGDFRPTYGRFRIDTFAVRDEVSR